MENNEALEEIFDVIENQQRTMSILNDKINALDRKSLEQKNEIKELVEVVGGIAESLQSSISSLQSTLKKTALKTDTIYSYIHCGKLNRKKADYEMKMTLRNGFKGVFGGAERRS